MSKILKMIAVFIMSAVLFGCRPNPGSKTDETKASKQEMPDEISENRGNEELLAINSSQYGMRYREQYILMQNRRGIRVEYCVDRSNLQLWISPLAGKSMSYKDRNWSNRDDHTNIFDRIMFPGLQFNDFDSCNWDPFHSILYYKNKTLHISQIYDQPCVLVWFEEGGKVEFKSKGGDDEIERTDKNFVIQSVDRKREFEYAACIGPGEGNFQHQPQLDEGRSTYCRAHLEPGQYLLVSGELVSEKPSVTAKNLAGENLDKHLSDSKKQIEEDLSDGRIVLKNLPEMQKLMDKSRVHAISMTDFDGFMRSCNNYIYYLMWYRDGGMNSPPLGYAGWTDLLYTHTKFVQANPNTSYEEPKGEFYGQLMAGPITKWEEDGLFYVIWPAFTYWTQTGDKSLCEGKNLETMENAMKWLEDYIYDEEKGLFGRYHYCETPMTGSRGDGWDQAVGKPTWKWASTHEEDTIVRGYDVYINMLNYACYMMLSAMTEGDKAERYFAKAKTLEKNMEKWFNIDGEIPSYGNLLTAKGEMITAEAYGMDRTDYQWSINLPLLLPNWPGKLKTAREQMLQNLIDEPKGNFLCSYYAILRALDNEIHDEEKIMKAMKYPVKQCVNPGKYWPMPYTIVEIVDAPEGHPFHDVRPLTFSSSQWYGALTNLALKRYAFGIAVRATKYMDRIENYHYQNGKIQFNYQGEGEIEKILVNGNELKHSYQLPLDQIKDGDNEVIVKMSAKVAGDNILMGSSLELLSVQDDRQAYFMKAYGNNVLEFKNLNKNVQVTDEQGNEVKLEKQVVDHVTYLGFSGRGKFEVVVEEKK